MDGISRRLTGLRSTRDFRAEVALLAMQASSQRSPARLVVTASAISAETLRREWSALLAVLDPSIRQRLTLELGEPRVGEPAVVRPVAAGLDIGRPNHRYEVLRALVAVGLANGGGETIASVVSAVGASQTPVRDAIEIFGRDGLLRRQGRRLSISAEDISSESIARLGATPTRLRFRFERGAMPRTPLDLWHRALTLAGVRHATPWAEIALSGVGVAAVEAPSLDVLGMPRLDLVAYLPRDTRRFDPLKLRALDDGLEPEPSSLAPAPVVVTVVRASGPGFRSVGDLPGPCAAPADVFLSLIDIGLREQALHYARAVRGPASSV